MLKLYFGTTATNATTLLIVAMIIFMGISFWKRDSIHSWGRLILLLVLWGLLICCTAAMRQGGYYYSVLHMVEGVGEPGLFAAWGLHAMVGGALAIIAVVSALVALFVKGQNVREILFFVISGAFTFKIVFMETCRIINHFSVK
ncbi:MAG: hypothetical protein RR528_09560 [Angelakisella sp.]